MIIYDVKFDDRFHLEVVDGIDITKTYLNSSRVHSCMSGRPRQLTELYTRIPNCRLVRLLRLKPFSSIVALRALLWLGVANSTGKPVMALDRVYTEEMEGYSHGLMREFLDCWRASVRGPVYDRGGLPDMWVDVPPICTKIKYRPYMDTFTYYEEYNKLLNFKPYFTRIKQLKNSIVKEQSKTRPVSESPYYVPYHLTVGAVHTNLFNSNLNTTVPTSTNINKWDEKLKH